MVSSFAKIKAIHYTLIGLFIVQLSPGIAWADSRLENLRFEAAGRVVRIFYDLDGPIGQPFNVRIFMKKGSDPNYEYEPTNARGDVGKSVPAGTKKVIVWDTTLEFPEGLKGNDIYFVADVEDATGGISTTVWIAGGALVAGGVLALLLSHSKDTQDISVPQFPAPPGRP